MSAPLYDSSKVSNLRAYLIALTEDLCNVIRTTGIVTAVARETFQPRPDNPVHETIVQGMAHVMHQAGILSRAVRSLEMDLESVREMKITDTYDDDSDDDECVVHCPGCGDTIHLVH